jgi:hypothetical protein
VAWFFLEEGRQPTADMVRNVLSGV